MEARKNPGPHHSLRDTPICDCSPGKFAVDANFFKETNGKWAVFDNFGNVARMPESRRVAPLP